MRSYHAACQCGAVRFVVTLDRKTATRCICARCRGQGISIAHSTRDQFRIVTGSDHLTEQIGAARTPHHFFCQFCGEAVFGHMPDPQNPVVSVNVACLDRGDLRDLSAPDPAQWQAKQ